MLRPDAGTSRSASSEGLGRKPAAATSLTRLPNHQPMDFTNGNMMVPMMFQMFQALQSAQGECPLTLLRTPQSTPHLEQFENITATARHIVPRMRLSDAASSSTASPMLSDAAASTVQPSTEALKSISEGHLESASQVSNSENQHQAGSQSAKSPPGIAEVMTALADRKKECAKAAAEAKKRKTDTTNAVKDEVKHGDVIKQKERETDDEEMPPPKKGKQKGAQVVKRPAANKEQISKMLALSGSQAAQKEQAGSAVETTVVITPQKGKRRRTVSDGESDTEVTPTKNKSVRTQPPKRTGLPVVVNRESKSQKIERSHEHVETGRAQHKECNGMIHSKPYLLKGVLHMSFNRYAF